MCNLQGKEIILAIGFTNICNCFASLTFMKVMMQKCPELEGTKYNNALKTENQTLARKTATRNLSQ